MSKSQNEIVAIEKAISKKYGDEAIQNPKSNWNPEKEKEYLKQMKALYTKVRHNEEQQEKVDINGIKVSKKLLNRDPLKGCTVCGCFPQKSMDDVCLLKFECCSKCHIQYVEGREERWLKGWRPNNGNSL
jgi:hypothetical protein